MRRTHRRLVAVAGLLAVLTTTLLAAAPAAQAAGADSTARPSISRTAYFSPQRYVWFGHWYPGPVCNGDICTGTSTDDLPRFWLSGENFNKGPVYVGIFRRDGSPIISRTVTAGVQQGFVPYVWGWQANMIDCAAINAPIHDNAFFQAKDLTNNLWSNRIFVTTDCAVL